MRILIVSINYHPELTGIGKYNGEMAEWLAQHGHDVNVITAPPYYPDWKVQDGYSSWQYKKEQKGNISVIRCPLWVPKQPSGLTRIIHLVSFALFSFPALVWTAVSKRPNIIFVLEPTFFCAPAAYVISRIIKAKSWLHIQDFEIDAAFDLGILNNKLLRNIVLSAEKWLMKRFDCVSTISDNMVKKLFEKGLDNNKCILFPNWIDTKQVYPLSHPPKIREELNIPENNIVLLYSGNMGEKQGLDHLIHAAEKLEDNDKLIFLLCGEGPAKKRLKASAINLKNVRFYPLQPIDKFNELLNLADIHLLPQRADVEDLVMPSKLTNMMASARPVVTTAQEGSQVANVVSHCGIVVPPNNIDELVNAIQILAKNKLLRKELGEKGREYAITNWSQDNVLNRVFHNTKGIPSK